MFINVVGWKPKAVIIGLQKEVIRNLQTWFSTTYCPRKVSQSRWLRIVSGWWTFSRMETPQPLGWICTIVWTPLQSRGGFFSYCFNGMSGIFMCALLLFLILDSSERGLTSLSLLYWVFIAEIFPEPSLLQADQPSNFSCPSCARCSDPFTFVSFNLPPAAHAHVCLTVGSLGLDTALRCVSPRQSRREGSSPLTW